MNEHNTLGWTRQAATLLSLFDNMNEGVCVHELMYVEGRAVDYRIIDVNPAYERLTGMSRDKALGLRASELYGTGAAPYLAEYQKVAETGESIQFRTFWSPMNKHFHVSVISHKKGMFATVFLDISDIKLAEEQLRVSEEKYRKLFNEFPVGLVRFDVQTGAVLECNAYFARLLGYEDVASCILGYSVERHYERSEDRAHMVNAISKFGEIKNYEILLRKIDGTTLWASLSAKIFVAEGYIEGAVSDITEVKKLEEKLRQSEKLTAIGQLAGGVAHDFNNQLASIVGYADMLDDELPEGSVLQQYVKNILIAAERASSLTAQLLAFARKGNYVAMPVNLNQIIREVITLLGHTVDRRIRFTDHLCGDIPVTLGDPDQIQNALMNLALNARDAMPSGGQITFTSDIVLLDADYCDKHDWEIRSGDYVRVCVTDNGTGMDAQTQARIFEPFFTTKEKGKGSGMGLSAVYGTVKNHKGAIHVYSEPGRGTTFTMYFPSAEDRVEENATPTMRPNEGRRDARILIVDDEPLLATMASDLLQRLGYRTAVCADGREATAFYEKEGRSIDLVILDMVMPVMNGRDTFHALRAIDPRVRVLLSSGYSINNETQEILQDGVLGFVQKPFRTTELLQKIDEVLNAEVSPHP